MAKRIAMVGVLAAVFAAGFVVRDIVPGEPVVHAQAPGRVFEMRTYTTAEGRLDALNGRFRDHTMRLFEKYGIQNVAYFVPMDTPDTLVYIIAHPSREAAKVNFSAFAKDPDWPTIAAESGVGRVQVESVFMTATDYSPLK
jgi:hypothetical protein